MLSMLGRMMRDEWAQYLYTGYDAGNRMYYRKTIDNRIDRCAVRMKNTFRSVGAIDVYEYIERKSAYNADDLDGHMDAVRNRMRTLLLQKLPYQYIDPLVRLSLTFLFAKLCKDISDANRMKLSRLYGEIMDLLADYVDAVCVETWTDLRGLLDVKMLEPLFNAITRMVARDIKEWRIN